MIALGLNFRSAPLDVYAAAVLFGTLVAAIVLVTAVREQQAIRRALATQLELVMVTIVLVVAGVSVLTHLALFVVAILALFQVMSLWFSVGALSFSAGADAVMLPVVLYLLTRGRASLRAREHLQPLSNPESGTGKE